MAIKLADVLENINLAYPVIEAHEKSIVGFYNGRATGAAQTIKLGYSGVSKISFSETANATNDLVALTSSYSAASGGGLIQASDADTLLTSHGGIFTVHDGKLYNDAQQVQSNYSAAYLVQELNAGTSAVQDTTRSSVVFVSELVQQFNRYESLPATGTESIPGIIEGGLNFYLAGFFENQKRTRKFKLNDFIALLGALFADELVEGGIVTTTQAGGTGIIGDLNGDGIVSIADLLILMNSFGQPGTAAVSLARGITEQTITTTPAAQGNPTGTGSGGAFVFSDFQTFDFPNPNSVNNQVYGWDSIDMTQGSANKITFDERGANPTWYENKRLRVYVAGKATAQAPDIVAAFCVVRVITQNSANNDFEAAYMMHMPGTFSNNLVQVTGLDAPVGQSFEFEFFYASGYGTNLFQSLDFQPETGVFSSSILESNLWNFATNQTAFDDSGNSGGTSIIKDIEVRVCLFSFAGYTEFQIQQVHAYVDEEPFAVTYDP